MNDKLKSACAQAEDWTASVQSKDDLLKKIDEALSEIHYNISKMRIAINEQNLSK